MKEYNIVWYGLYRLYRIHGGNSVEFARFQRFLIGPNTKSPGVDASTLNVATLLTPPTNKSPCSRLRLLCMLAFHYRHLRFDRYNSMLYPAIFYKKKKTKLAFVTSNSCEMQ